MTSSDAARGFVRYDAFISYNHKADGDFAPALQDALQNLAKPWYQRRAMTIFRDETNLSASPDLFESIADALDESRYYVLLASPGSAASEWVGKEIEYWTKTKTAAARRIVLVLTDGTLHWDSARGCYDPSTSTALQPGLEHTFSSDPLHIDMREAHKSVTDRSREQQRRFRRTYRGPVALIAAEIRGVNADMLESEDLRQHRRTLRVAWSAAFVLVLLTIAAVIGFISAQRSAADARDQTRVAQAGAIGASSTASLQTNSPLALALAVAADGHADSGLARDALHDAAAQPVMAAFGATAPVGVTVSAMAISPDGTRVATTDGSNRVVVWDVASKRRIAKLVDPNVVSVLALAFDRDGRQLAAAYQRPMAKDSDVLGPRGRNVVWNVATQEEIGDSWQDDGASLSSLAFAPDGSMVAGGDTSGNVVVWHPGSAKRVVAATGDPEISSVSYSSDGRRILATTRNSAGLIRLGVGSATVRDALTGAALAGFDVGTDVLAGAVSSDGSVVVTGDQRGRIDLWDPATGALTKSFTDDGPVTQLAVNRSGAVVVSGDSNGSVVARDTRTGATVATWSEGSAVSGLSFTSDDRTLATGDDRGHVVLRDADWIAPKTATSGVVLDVRFAPHGDQFVTSVASTADATQLPSVSRWSPSDETRLDLVDGSRPTLAMLSNDGRRAAIVSTTPGTTRITVVDTASGAVVKQWESSGAPDAIAFSPDDEAIVTEGGGQLESHDLATRSTEPTNLGHTRLPVFTESQYQPGPKLSVGARGAVVTVDQSGATIVWRKRRPLQLTGFAGGIESNMATLSPDGTMVAAIDGHFGTSTRQVDVWNLATRHRETFSCAGNERPTVVAFAPGSTTLAIGDDAHRVTLCDLAHDRALAQWATTGNVTALAFSADGRRLAAGDDTGHVTRWDASAYTSSPRQLSARLCRELRGYTVPESEWHATVPYERYADLCR
jgi:WD40 repeat protein